MFDEFLEAGMVDRFGFGIEHEQPSLVAAGQWLLRDQFFGQFVVEFRKPHLRSEDSKIPAHKRGRCLRRTQRFAASRAIAAAAVRVSTPSPSRMCSTCFDTVRELIPRIIAISGLVLPTAT